MLIAVVFFLFISLAIILGLTSPTVGEFKNVSANLESQKSYFLAESGSEDALYRILNDMPIDDSETLSLENNSVTTTISTPEEGSKQIISLGNVMNLERKVSLLLLIGESPAWTIDSWQ